MQETYSDVALRKGPKSILWKSPSQHTCSWSSRSWYDFLYSSVAVLNCLTTVLRKRINVEGKARLQPGYKLKTSLTIMSPDPEGGGYIVFGADTVRFHFRALTSEPVYGF